MTQLRSAWFSRHGLDTALYSTLQSFLTSTRVLNRAKRSTCPCTLSRAPATQLSTAWRGAAQSFYW